MRCEHCGEEREEWLTLTHGTIDCGTCGKTTTLEVSK